jgi:hypothetical protein
MMVHPLATCCPAAGMQPWLGALRRGLLAMTGWHKDDGCMQTGFCQLLAGVGERFRSLILVMHRCARFVRGLIPSCILVEARYNYLC